MNTEERSSEVGRKRVSAAWMWLAAGLMLVLVVGAAAVALFQGGDDETSGFPTGTFTTGSEMVEFNEDMTCRWFGSDGSWELPCKYAVNGDLYTEMWFEWAGYEPDEFFPATYFWSYDGENLTFELWGVDANASRQGSYTSTLVKSP